MFLPGFVNPIRTAKVNVPGDSAPLVKFSLPLIVFGFFLQILRTATPAGLVPFRSNAIHTAFHLRFLLFTVQPSPGGQGRLRFS